MEKRTPHHKLTDVQVEVALRGIDCFTRSALDGVIAMGLRPAQALAVIQSLTKEQFYKSMTTYTDHTVWQDVYHATTETCEAYIKFTLRTDGSIVISFKEMQP